MKQSLRLVRPWEDKWQLWKASKGDSMWRLESEHEQLEERLPPRTICAIPARFIVAAPLWIDTDKDEALDDMARLEAEMNGLGAGERLSRDFRYRVLSRQNGRTQIVAIVFPPELPNTLAGFRGDTYEPSPLLCALQDKTLHLWREFDDLVAVLVWNGCPICWETLCWPADIDQVEAWLRCFLIQSWSWAPSQRELAIKDWIGILRILPEGFVKNLPVTQSDRKEGPTIPLSPLSLGWLPAAERVASEAMKRRRTVGRGIVASALLVIAALLGFGAYSLSISWKIRKIDQQLASIETRIAPIRETASRWTQVEPAIDEKFFPLEMLHLVVSSLPPAGVRLTEFEMAPRAILVVGEASNVSAATELVAKLRDNKQIADVAWQMPPPSLQPNNTARFVITGERSNAQ